MYSYAAGVLVVAWHNNELYFLLGKDHYNTYSDFGGKCEDCDGGLYINTACRELYEETCGCFLDRTIIRSMLAQCEFVQSLSYTSKPYFMYVMAVNYDENIKTRFDTCFKYVSSVSKMPRHTEKIALDWINIANVTSGDVRLRNVFHKTLQKHKASILKIAYKLKPTNS